MIIGKNDGVQREKKKRNLMTKDRIQLTPSALETYLAGVAIS